jgi:hypothetical protein
MQVAIAQSPIGLVTDGLVPLRRPDCNAGKARTVMLARRSTGPFGVPLVQNDTFYFPWSRYFSA